MGKSVTFEGIEPDTLMSLANSVSKMCCFHPMNNVFALMESLGVSLQTVSKRTTKMKNGWTCYWLTTSVPIDNSFFSFLIVSRDLV